MPKEVILYVKGMKPGAVDSIILPLSTGVPQGSGSGPLLFTLNTELISFCGYSDLCAGDLIVDDVEHRVGALQNEKFGLNIFLSSKFRSLTLSLT